MVSEADAGLHPIRSVPPPWRAPGRTGVLLFGCLLPVLNYLGFLLSYLIIDLLRAILSVPANSMC